MLLTDLLRGAVAGGVSTWFMDLVTTGVAQGQSASVTARESAASPHGRSSVGNLVDRIDERLGLDLSTPARTRAEQVIHYGLGVGPAAAYAVALRRSSKVAIGQGLLFGLGLWLVNDEYLNAKLGLAGPWEAYPMETHWRGVVGHAALGVSTHAVVRMLGGRTG